MRTTNFITATLLASALIAAPFANAQEGNYQQGGGNYNQPGQNYDQSQNGNYAPDPNGDPNQQYAQDGVEVAPPVAPAYDVPVCPGDGYIWAPGYWAYGPNGYYWVNGTWVLAPYVGAVWTPGYWGWGFGGWFWHIGFWGFGGYGWGWHGFGFYNGAFWGHGPGYFGFHGFHEGIFVHTSYGGALYRGGANLQPHWNQATLNHTVSYNHGGAANGFRGNSGPSGFNHGGSTGVHTGSAPVQRTGGQSFGGASHFGSNSFNGGAGHYGSPAGQTHSSFGGGSYGGGHSNYSAPSHSSGGSSHSFSSHSSGGGHSGGGGHGGHR
jgi:hypothetical protein